MAGEAVAVEIDEIADELWGVVLDSYDLDDVEPHKLEFHSGLVNSAIRRAFGDLELLGVLAVSGVHEHTTEYGTTEEAGGVVTITPLGAWVMQHIAADVVDVSDDGRSATGTGDVAGARSSKRRRGPRWTEPTLP